VLLGLARSRVGSALPPREARARVFATAARVPARPAVEVLAKCARELRVAPEALRDALFADLPGERLAFPPASLDPGELALRANLLLAQALLARAFRVDISIEGNARAVVRHASLRGLICSVTPGLAGEGARLEVSGPFALFRRTLLYGPALGSLLPVLAWTRRFRLDADCELRGRAATVTLASGDPIFPSAEPRRFDSQVEERFARDFGRAAPGWTVVREPEPIQAGGHLVFPDFAVHRRHEPGARWLVEIVGFWTAEYLAAKLERLRDARIANLVLCIDEERNVGASGLPLRPGSYATAGGSTLPLCSARSPSSEPLPETSCRSSTEMPASRFTIRHRQTKFWETYGRRLRSHREFRCQIKRLRFRKRVPPGSRGQYAANSNT